MGFNSDIVGCNRNFFLRIMGSYYDLCGGFLSHEIQFLYPSHDHVHIETHLVTWDSQ